MQDIKVENLERRFTIEYSTPMRIGVTEPNYSYYDYRYGQSNWHYVYSKKGDTLNFEFETMQGNDSGWATIINNQISNQKIILIGKKNYIKFVVL